MNELYTKLYEATKNKTKLTPPETKELKDSTLHAC
jgi:hypothetical protein